MRSNEGTHGYETELSGGREEDWVQVVRVCGRFAGAQFYITCIHGVVLMSSPAKGCRTTRRQLRLTRLLILSSSEDTNMSVSSI